MSAADKRALGLAAVGGPRTRVAVPATAPVVHVSVTAPNVHTVRFADSSAPNRRAKPAGVDGLQVFVAFTDGTPDAASRPTPDDAAYRAFVTRQNESIAHPPTRTGHVAHYFARWQNRRGEPGPWSAATSVAVAG